VRASGQVVMPATRPANADGTVPSRCTKHIPQAGSLVLGPLPPKLWPGCLLCSEGLAIEYKAAASRMRPHQWQQACAERRLKLASKKSLLRKKPSI